VPAGRHRVLFEYRPAALLPLLLLSYGMLVAVTAIGLRRLRRALEMPTSPPAPGSQPRK